LFATRRRMQLRRQQCRCLRLGLGRGRRAGRAHIFAEPLRARPLAVRPRPIHPGEVPLAACLVTHGCTRLAKDVKSSGRPVRTGDGAPGAPARAGLVLAALIVVAGVANLNLSVANVALPDIGKHFDSSQTTLDLIAVGYSLGLACSVLWL